MAESRVNIHVRYKPFVWVWCIVLLMRVLEWMLSRTRIVVNGTGPGIPVQAEITLDYVKEVQP